MTKASARSAGATDLNRPTNIIQDRATRIFSLDFFSIYSQLFSFGSPRVRLQTISARRWCHPLFLTCNLNFFFSVGISPPPPSQSFHPLLLLGLVSSCGSAGRFSRDLPNDHSYFLGTIHNE
jgi:hypothetical protein